MNCPDCGVKEGEFHKLLCPSWQADTERRCQYCGCYDGKHYENCATPAGVGEIRLPREDKIRIFNTGATRDANQDKPDYEGFLSPLVLEDFANYMHGKRVQPDGNLRDSDNWQKGIPLEEYMKSLMRHVFHLWLIHRGREAKDEKGNEVTLRDTLCAIEFNCMGYHFETLKDK